MKITFFFIVILLSMNFAKAQEIYIVNSNSETLSHVQIYDFSVTNNFAQIGQYGNHITYHEERLYIVNSGDNNIQVVDLEGVTRGFINLENSSNPWHINIHNGFIYVTGLFTGKLYRIDLNAPFNTHFDKADGNFLYNELFIGTTPQGMLVHDNKMFVALAGVYFPDYGQGKVAIIDLETFSIVDTIDVAQNPQELIVDSRGYIHVVCTGNYAELTSKIVIFDSQNFEIVHTLDFDWSFFTTIQKGPDGLIYVGNGFGLGFATYDPITYEIINGFGNTLFTGGQYLIYDSQFIYVLEPDWLFNSSLNIYTHDHDIVRQISLGIGSLAMVMHNRHSSIDDIVMPNSYEVFAYPNPFMSEIKFDIKGFVKEITIDVFNIRGQKIATTSDRNWDGKNMFGIDVPAGMYFARISDGNEVIVKKILRIK
ncbi:MAG: T9SS type A sorting domain-containing protein [Candidatus Cloacimonetes bacterium]|nr:T9SS type A sorting domain-containing protein [Candidatus Cloacimonadota bacterium]